MQKNDNLTFHNASEYNSQINNTIPYYDMFHSETINFVRNFSAAPALWLDTGCGTGTLVEKSLPVFKNTAFVLCDPSQAMLENAKERLVSDRVSFLPPSPSQTLSLDNDAPDIITAIQAHHYLTAEGRMEATKNCCRLLKKDGVFITFENIRPMTLSGEHIGLRMWSNFQTEHGKTPEQAAAHLSRYGHEFFPITVEEHLALYRSCGFRVVELLWYSVMQAGFYCIK